MNTQNLKNFSLSWDPMPFFSKNHGVKIHRLISYSKTEKNLIVYQNGASPKVQCSRILFKVCNGPDLNTLWIPIVKYFHVNITPLLIFLSIEIFTTNFQNMVLIAFIPVQRVAISGDANFQKWPCLSKKCLGQLFRSIQAE